MILPSKLRCNYSGLKGFLCQISVLTGSNYVRVIVQLFQTATSQDNHHLVNIPSLFQSVSIFPFLWSLFFFIAVFLPPLVVLDYFYLFSFLISLYCKRILHDYYFTFRATCTTERNKIWWEQKNRKTKRLLGYLNDFLCQVSKHEGEWHSYIK